MIKSLKRDSERSSILFLDQMVISGVYVRECEYVCVHIHACML